MSKQASRPKHSVPAVLGRWMIGKHWDGRNRGDGSFFARAVEAEEHWLFGQNGSPWARAAGWHRTAIRLGVIAVVAGLWRWRHGTEWVLVLAGGPMVGLLAVAAYRHFQSRRHRREVVRPLAEALSPSLELSPSEAEQALTVPRRYEDDDAKILAALPDGWQGHDGQRETMTRIVGHRLGGEWVSRVQRRPLVIVLTHRPQPPRSVKFADVADLIRNEGGPMRILMGLGPGGEPFWLDFKDLIVNLGVSVGTGGGKSAFLRFLIAQFAYFGAADFPVIDTKMVSLAGMEAIPGLRVHDDIPEQWAALEALAADIDHRYTYLKANPGYQFPLCVPLLEEQNDFSIASRSAWLEMRASKDPLTPPVYQPLTRMVIKGRQVGYRTFGVYQRLTAEACGGMTASVMRDAYGGKALARHSEQAWDSLTGIRPWVPPSDIPGRWVLVAGGKANKVQVPYGEPEELVEFAISSPLAQAGAPEKPWHPAYTPQGHVQDMRGEAARVPDQAVVRGTTPDTGVTAGLHVAPRYLTQGETAEALGMSLAAFAKWRERCRKGGSPLPEPKYFSARPGWTDNQVEEMAQRRPAPRMNAGPVNGSRPSSRSS